MPKVLLGIQQIDRSTNMPTQPPGSHEPPPNSSDTEMNPFESPRESDLGHEAAELEEALTASSFGEELLSLKTEIEAKVCAAAAQCNAEATVQSLDAGNIVGVGLTTYGADELAAGAPGLPGEPALVVYTVERVGRDELVAEVAQAAGTSALSAAPIVQVATGVVDAYAHRMRLRPAPGGISVGPAGSVSAGTFGCLVRGNSAPRSSRLMILSNNHVLARSNAAPLGESIVQPGRLDGGVHPRDQVAILERFVPINFASGAINHVDCATAWAWPDRVRKEIMRLVGTSPHVFPVSKTPLAPAVGLQVGKSGRTTQLTQGRVNAVGVSVNVNFPGIGVAHFRDQFSVRAGTGDFSRPGDSGSLVWTWDSARRPVGLLFAGGGGTTFCNRIARVLTALDVQLFV